MNRSIKILSSVLILLMLTVCTAGCGEKTDSEFSLTGSWKGTVPFTQQEKDLFDSMYEESGEEIYRSAVADETIYTFREDGTYVREWHFVDKDGNRFAEPQDGAYNTGDTYFGTYVLEEDVLTLTENDINSNPIYTSEYKISAQKSGSFEMTLVKINSRDISSGTPIPLEKCEEPVPEGKDGPVKGDILTFGKYEQDNDLSDGKEDIEWIVLAADADRVLVISRYALDIQPFNEAYEPVTWETCTLRQWLNDPFLQEAFTPEEQERIQETVVSADANPHVSTDPGNDTKDRVFLLSIVETDKYFSSDGKRACTLTPYARAKTPFPDYCPWWLRSPGTDRIPGSDEAVNAAVVIHNDGYAVDHGTNVDDSTSTGGRPAMWIIP